MIVVRGPAQADRIADPEIRRLVEERFTQVCAGEPYNPEIHGEMVVVEPGDSLCELERGTGLPVATNPFDNSRFPNVDFVPVCEHLEEHAGCYEIVFIFTDDGAGTNLFVPKSPGVDAELLALCARFAVAAPEVAP